MADESDSDRAWELMRKIMFCMLTTRDGEDLRSRPMAASVRPHEHAIYFLTDARRHKSEEISRFPNVCCAFADAKSQKYVSVAGRAAVTNDRAKIRELWSTSAQAWWDGPEDPNIRLLTITPHDAEYWDSPGTVVSYIKMAAAAATGGRPDLGDNKKVNLG
jgi:general stress protein 26